MTSLEAWNKQTRKFGYDAVDHGHKRRMASTNLRSEDAELISQKRKQLQAQSQDCLRNFSVARFIVGRHLDYVSRFSFSSQTKTDFDYEFEARMREWCEDPRKCDVTARHTFQRMLRMTEGRAVVGGDHLLIKCNGQKLQQIESDRIRTFNQTAGTNVVHGVVQDDSGAAIAYQVHRRGRNGSGYEFQAEIPAENCLFHAYFPGERSDQTRGVGLISTGISDLVDVYEWADIAKATEKARAAMGMIFKTTNEDAVGEYSEWGNGKYNVALGRGPLKLELDKDDSVEFLSSDTPAGNTVAFFNSCIGFALKSLDIPYSMFAENYTNYSGQRSAMLSYLESCKPKRDNLRANILHPLTRWLARSWIADGSLTLPSGATSTTLNRLPFAWRPAGVPWFDPLKELTASIMAVRSGFGTYSDLYAEATGRDWFESVERLAEEQAHIKKTGVVLDETLAPVMAATLIGQQQQQPIDVPIDEANLNSWM